MTPPTRLHQLTVRRHQGDEARSSNDFVLRGDDLKRLDRQLREVLRTAQAQRGTGLWSAADPEVWQSGSLIGRLGRDGDITLLVRLALEACGKVSADRNA
jgi:hypothetical protein